MDVCVRVCVCVCVCVCMMSRESTPINTELASLFLVLSFLLRKMKKVNVNMRKVGEWTHSDVVK